MNVLGERTVERREGEMLQGDEEPASWKLLQIGMVVRDLGQAEQRFSELGFGPFRLKALPAGQEWFRTSQRGSTFA